MWVYRHRRLDTNEIFYVGIGTSKYRATEKTRRSEFWKHIVSKTDYSVEIIAEVDTWELACELEQLLIQEYGRRDLGTGTLVNMTDGGDGALGLKHSEETRKKIGEASRGNSNMLGKKHSEETKRKLAEKAPQRRIVLDTQTGVFYKSITEASFYYDINRNTLVAMLNGLNPNKTNLIKI